MSVTLYFYLGEDQFDWAWQWGHFWRLRTFRLVLTFSNDSLINFFLYWCVKKLSHHSSLSTSCLQSFQWAEGKQFWPQRQGYEAVALHVNVHRYCPAAQSYQIDKVRALRNTEEGESRQMKKTRAMKELITLVSKYLELYNQKKMAWDNISTKRQCQGSFHFHQKAFMTFTEAPTGHHSLGLFHKLVLLIMLFLCGKHWCR